PRWLNCEAQVAELAAQRPEALELRTQRRVGSGWRPRWRRRRADRDAGGRPAAAGTQCRQNLLAVTAAQPQQQEWIAVQLAAQDVVHRRDVLAGIGPVRAGALCPQRLVRPGEERHADGGEDV